MTLKTYLKKLSAKTPTPGGGSAAALVGALGAALVSMAAKYNLKRAKTESAKKKIKAIANFSEKAVLKLVALMREDERAYLKLAKELKKCRPCKLLSLYKNALLPPMEICSIAAETAPKAKELIGFSSASIMSDVIESAILLESAFFSAKLNVEINLLSIEDASYKKKIKSALDKAEEKAVNSKKAALRRAAMILR